MARRSYRFGLYRQLRQLFEYQASQMLAPIAVIRRVGQQGCQQLLGPGRVRLRCLQQPACHQEIQPGMAWRQSACPFFEPLPDFRRRRFRQIEFD